MTKSVVSEVNLYIEGNRFLQPVLIYSERGNININRNIFLTAKENTIHLRRPGYLNITENLFLRNLQLRFAGKNYIEVERNIDADIAEYISWDQLNSYDMIVEKNKLRSSYQWYSGVIIWFYIWIISHEIKIFSFLSLMFKCSLFKRKHLQPTVMSVYLNDKEFTLKVFIKLPLSSSVDTYIFS